MRAVKQANDDLAQARHIVAAAASTSTRATTTSSSRSSSSAAIGGICVHTHVVGPQVKEMVRALPRRRRRRRAGARRGAAPGVRAAAGADEPDRDQGGAEPARPRGRRAPPAARRSDADGASSPVRGCLERLGLLQPQRLTAASSAEPHPATLELARMMTDVMLAHHPARRARRGRQEHDRLRGRTSERIVVDAGLAFPRDEHLGVDLVLPDFALPARTRARSAAIVLTHGHEDHVGSLPYSDARGARCGRSSRRG